MISENKNKDLFYLLDRIEEIKENGCLTEEVKIHFWGVIDQFEERGIVDFNERDELFSIIELDRSKYPELNDIIYLGKKDKK